MANIEGYEHGLHTASQAIARLSKIVGKEPIKHCTPEVMKFGS
jgi:hypothetical protein